MHLLDLPKTADKQGDCWLRRCKGSSNQKHLIMAMWCSYLILLVLWLAAVRKQSNMRVILQACHYDGTGFADALALLSDCCKKDEEPSRRDKILESCFLGGPCPAFSVEQPYLNLQRTGFSLPKHAQFIIEAALGHYSRKLTRSSHVGKLNAMQIGHNLGWHLDKGSLALAELAGHSLPDADTSAQGGALYSHKKPFWHSVNPETLMSLLTPDLSCNTGCMIHAQHDNDKVPQVGTFPGRYAPKLKVTVAPAAWSG